MGIIGLDVQRLTVQRLRLRQLPLLLQGQGLMQPCLNFIIFAHTRSILCVHPRDILGFRSTKSSEQERKYAAKNANGNVPASDGPNKDNLITYLNSPIYSIKRLLALF